MFSVDRWLGRTEIDIDLPVSRYRPARQSQRLLHTSNDGHLRAHSAEDGKLLWEFDTVRDFETVNGVKGRGGSIDGPGAVVVNGMVFINSGYPRNGGVPGNVLLAFAPE